MFIPDFMSFDAIIQPGAGFTVTRDLQPVTSGFAVAIRPECERIIPLSNLTPEIWEANVISYLHQWQDTFRNPLYNFGAWNNEGHIFLDAPCVETHEQHAVNLGVEFGQLAIYDLSTGTEISLWLKTRNNR